MNILFLGDIVGKSGREIIRDLLPSLKEKYKSDFVIANGENAAHGKGLTLNIYEELISYGIDAITMGNHTYSKHNIIENISKMERLIVPNNFIDKVGSGYRLFEINKRKVCVANILGRYSMGDYMSDPYESYQDIIDHVRADIFIVDMHAEATDEKRLFAEYFKSHAQCVLGTHTHVQTADEAVLNNKTAFIRDVGMCGPYNSIIGRDINETIRSNILHEKTRYEIAEGQAILCGVSVTIDDNSCLPVSIERIQIRP